MIRNVEGGPIKVKKDGKGGRKLRKARNMIWRKRRRNEKSKKNNEGGRETKAKGVGNKEGIGMKASEKLL